MASACRQRAETTPLMKMAATTTSACQKVSPEATGVSASGPTLLRIKGILAVAAHPAAVRREWTANLFAGRRARPLLGSSVTGRDENLPSSSV